MAICRKFQNYAANRILVWWWWCEYEVLSAAMELENLNEYCVFIVEYNIVFGVCSWLILFSLLAGNIFQMKFVKSALTANPCFVSNIAVMCSQPMLVCMGSLQFLTSIAATSFFFC